VPSADVPVTGAYDLRDWWPTKATPVLPYEVISIVTIFAAPLLGAATNVVELRSTNNSTEREISWKDSSIVSSNSGALPLATRNGLLISLP